MLSTYSGTKAFLSSFTGALNEEVRGRGVDVECVNTYFVVRPVLSHPASARDRSPLPSPLPPRRSRTCRRSAARARSSPRPRRSSTACSRRSRSRAARCGRSAPASSRPSGATPSWTTSWCVASRAPSFRRLTVGTPSLAERARLEHGIRALHARAAQGHPPPRAPQDRARGQKAVRARPPHGLDCETGSWAAGRRVAEGIIRRAPPANVLHDAACIPRYAVHGPRNAHALKIAHTIQVSIRRFRRKDVYT